MIYLSIFICASYFTELQAHSPTGGERSIGPRSDFGRHIDLSISPYILPSASSIYDTPPSYSSTRRYCGAPPAARRLHTTSSPSIPTLHTSIPHNTQSMPTRLPAARALLPQLPRLNTHPLNAHAHSTTNAHIPDVLLLF